MSNSEGRWYLVYVMPDVQHPNPHAEFAVKTELSGCDEEAATQEASRMLARVVEKDAACDNGTYPKQPRVIFEKTLTVKRTVTVS